MRLKLGHLAILACTAIQPVNWSSGGTPTNALSSDAVAYLERLATGTNASMVGPLAPLSPPQAGTNLVAIESLDDKQRLGIGDRISFRIIEDKDDPKPLVVTDSGELEIPYVGRMASEGKTCRELALEIKQVLERKYYYRATVVVAVDLLNKAHGKVYLAGQIRLPGFQDIPTDENFTVSKAILRAGGFSDFADKKHVKVTRKKGATENQIITVDVAEIVEKGHPAKDLKLDPDDLVFVPAKILNF